MKILGIETSCDETAAAVVGDGCTVLSSAVYTQIAQHRPFGGVVPEIACRDHVRKLPGIIQDAMEQARTNWTDLTAVAVTYGPGLSSSLLIGLSGAKALAARIHRPLIGVNHLEGHLCSVFLAEDSPPAAECGPMLVLLVSGGHSFLIHLEKPGHFQLLGKSFDDAAGEALDKGANLLNLGYPGGPHIEKAAEGGNPAWIHFPRGEGGKGPSHLTPGLQRDLCFSFSGLKTALRYYLQKHPEVLEDGSLKHVAASYQQAVCDALVNRADLALQRTGCRTFACVGGVAKNKTLRAALEQLALRHEARLLLTPLTYCTDNAAMIAAAALLRLQADAAHFNPADVHPNLPLDSWG
jgi:N6-L-threonylcarbamoyladenine synthase